MIEIKNDEYYWLLPFNDDEWIVGRAEETRRMGFQSKSFDFYCSNGDVLTVDSCREIRHIQKPTAEL